MAMDVPSGATSNLARLNGNTNKRKQEMNAERITINVGTDDNGIVQWAECNNEELARKALAFIRKEKQERLAEKRRNAKTCRNCKYAIIERIGAFAPQTCKCSLRTHGKYNQWHKQMRLNQTCELFERIEEESK